MLQKIFKFISTHKIITAIIILLIVGGSYSGYKSLKNKSQVTRYVMAAVEKGTIIASVSGSGQISTSNQIDIKSKVSGDIVYVGAEEGQEVKNGQLILKIDDSDAQKAIRDAETNLETAQISLSQAKDDLKTTYEDGFNEVTNVFLDFPSIMSGLKDILFDDSLGNVGSWNLDTYEYYAEPYDNKKSYQYTNDIYYTSYQEAKKLYEQNFSDYKSVSVSSDQETIKSLIDETYQTTKSVAEAVKNTYNLLQSYKNALTDQNLTVNSTVDTYISNLNSYLTKTNSHLNNLLSYKNTIEVSIGSVPYSVRSAQISVKQKEDDLSEAKENLTNYYIRAPFDGVIAEINVEKSDSVSSATTLATLITKQKIAGITLNEVDAAKVKMGQKATLTFDALPDLTITGKVIEVDTVGTVSQGVVSYEVKIALDTQNETIKPSMSVTVDIITDAKQDVLVVPNNAVKSQGNSHYVEVIENPSEEIKQKLSTNVSGMILPQTPKQQTVEIGLSNDTSTEIISGLKEGDIVVTSTISSNNSSSSSTTRSSSQNQIRIPGVGGF
jgi:HlyD family secretion protein